ncbi:hypothetical protein MTO96_005171 [Rhipicephalus appendiculatus]
MKGAGEIYPTVAALIISSDCCDHTVVVLQQASRHVRCATLTCGSSADAPLYSSAKPGWTSTSSTTLKMDEEELAVVFARVRRRNRQTGFL